MNTFSEQQQQLDTLQKDLDTERERNSALSINVEGVKKTLTTLQEGQREIKSILRQIPAAIDQSVAAEVTKRQDKLVEAVAELTHKELGSLRENAKADIQATAAVQERAVSAATAVSRSACTDAVQLFRNYIIGFSRGA